MARRLCLKGITFHRPATFSQRRTIFSKAYLCEEDWGNRKQSPALKDVEPYELLNTLLIRSQSNQLTSAIDLDIAANAINNTDQLTDFEDILYKFRHCKNSVSTLNSTHHALVRAYVHFNRIKDLMRILSDPINYGIFPDSYAANMLMDRFLKAGNTRDAAKVACFMMQQEDFVSKSCQWLMLHGCLKWLEHAEPAEWTEKLATNDTLVEDDEIIFRVPFLKSHYNDNHFDLTSAEHLVGKTLNWVSQFCLQSDDKIDKNVKNVLLNCQFIGAVLWQDEKELQKVIELIENQKMSIFNDVPLLAKIEQPIKGEADKTDGKDEKSEWNAKIQDLCQNFSKTDLSLLSSLEHALKQNVEEFEKVDISSQKMMFEKWNNLRETKIDNQIKTYLNQERLKVIQSQLNAMSQETEHMFFFENKEELEKRIPQIQKENEAEKLNVDHLKTKGEQNIENLPDDEDYVVPELKRSKNV